MLLELVVVNMCIFCRTQHLPHESQLMRSLLSPRWTEIRSLIVAEKEAMMSSSYMRDEKGKKMYTEKFIYVGDYSLKDDPYLLENEAKFAREITACSKIEYGHIFVHFSQKAATNVQEILDNDPGLQSICSCLLTGVPQAFNTHLLLSD